jgi:hypothetical protein
MKLVIDGAPLANSADRSLDGGDDSQKLASALLRRPYV